MMLKMKELFDKCIKEAIKIGRPYMKYVPESIKEPTKEEWALALALFKHKLEDKNGK